MGKIIAISNQKGGTGKTTTAVNLGIGLANEGKKVLLIDYDAQGSLTQCWGYPNPDELSVTISSLMEKVIREQPVLENEGILHHKEGVDFIPANIELSGMETFLVNTMSRERVLKNYLSQITDNYDYVLIDCPPSLGLLTVNALNAANGLLIPVQVEYYALAGLALIRQTAELVRDLNPDLAILGLVLTFFDARKTLNKDVAAALADEWGDALFSTRIRDNVSLAEAPSNGQDVFSYKRSCYGAKDYAAFAAEFLERTEGCYGTRG